MSVRVGESGVIGKSGEKSKNKEMVRVEEMYDCRDVEYVQCKQDLGSRVEKKKNKNKENEMVAGWESVNEESFGQFDSDNQPEKVEKEKKGQKGYQFHGIIFSS